MIQRLILYLFVAVIAAGWTLGGHTPPTAATTVEDRVGAIAAGMSAITPKTLPSGIVMRTVRADGRTLVAQMDGVHDWRPTYTDDEMKRMMAVGICSHATMGSVFGEGARLRFELTSPTGATLPPLTIDRCP